MKFIKSNIYQGVHAQTGYLADIKEIVQTDDGGVITATLDQILNGLQTGVNNAITQNTLNTAVNTAVSNALNNGSYVQASTLKTITVNGTEQSLLKSGSNTTINITTGGGSGSGSTVSFIPTFTPTNPNATTALKIGTITIDDTANDIYIQPVSMSKTGVLTSGDYETLRYGSLLLYGVQNSDIDNAIRASYLSDQVRLATAKVGNYYVYLAKLNSNYGDGGAIFTAEGLIKWDVDNSKFIIDSTAFRKYLIQQSGSSASTRIVTLISSSDMFEYTSNTNTLSITTE